MTDSTSASLRPPDFSSWDEKNRAHARLAAELLPANKAALFDTLAAAGIAIVTVVFDGYGDSGQIEDIEAKAGDDVIALPHQTIEIVKPVWGSSEIERHIQLVREAIETMAYAFLSASHSGWENSDGAYGDFVFDVTARTITLDYNERMMTSESYSHNF